MMTINQLLQKLDTASPILQATFGLERENLRVTTDGHLAQTAHPSQLGSRNFHPTKHPNRFQRATTRTNNTYRSFN